MASKQSIQFYPSTKCSKENFKCLLIAELSGVNVDFNTSDSLKSVIPYYPAISDGSVVVFGSNAVCKYLAKDVAALDSNSLSSNNLLDIEEFKLASFTITPEEEKTVLLSLEASKPFEQHIFASYVLYNSFTSCANMTEYAYLHSVMTRVSTSEAFQKATARLAALNTALAAAAAPPAAPAAGGKKDKATKKEKGAKDSSSAAPAAAAAPANYDDIVKPVLGEVDWASTGLMSSLKIIFSAAILAAFPQSKDLQMDTAAVMRCANPAHGDFQCNNAMALSKSLKGVAGYSGPVSPKDIAERIIYALPDNSIISGTSAAPNGFINIKLSTTTLINSIASITVSGAKPPSMPPRKVLVDFSSPNIAKEMHVGHLRSTIIGDSICRILEFCQFEVLRINHVGDWGTQFGMLITYLQEAYPDILTNPPNISDLTAIYKESKKRFDADEHFKETSRLNVVRLQGGDAACRAIWTLLCNISRKEFQVVYDCLGVTLDEVGESFYNEMIPGAIQDLQAVNLVEDEQGMLIIKLPHFTIPLIVRKSDGGYGYDSTDMAALKYRIFTLQCDWLVYITDAGQQPHFHMCFDAAKAAGWVGEKRIEHIGFGVVCGDDGKRFKTRSSETVRLIDLLNAAKDRMKESLQSRADEGKSNLTGEELEEAAKIIGYGAVKYFDLKQHPSTNYIFSYDRMLDTKGDTAVYLLFAYARLASILRKAKEEKNIDIASHTGNAHNVLVLDHPAERALAFELLQLGDVVKSVIQELLPNRLCDYLKELAVKFTDFVTKCHVLNAETEAVTISRLLLCEAAKRVMAQCFSLLGIGTLDRI